MCIPYIAIQNEGRRPNMANLRLASVSWLLWLCSIAAVLGTTTGYAREFDVRLVGETPDNVTLPPNHYVFYGRVEIYYGGWGSVCDADWETEDANVVCRQLGFSRALSAHPNAYYGEGSGHIALGNVRCRGHEENLVDCEHDPWYEIKCGHAEDVGVHCDTTDLIDPCISDPCLNGAVCVPLDGDLGVFSKEFICVCETGFAGDFCEREAVRCDSSPCHNGGTCNDLGDSYNCTCPDEWTSTHCDVAKHPCQSNPCMNGASCREEFDQFICSCTDNWAGPSCEGVSELYYPRFGGGSLFGSTLEVWDGDSWRRVCTDNFGEEEAATACKQLGYNDFSFGYLVSDPDGDGDYDTQPLDIQFVCGTYDVKLSDCGTRRIHPLHCGSVDLNCEEYSFFTSPYSVILYVVIVHAIVIPVGVYLKRRKRRIRTTITNVRVDLATAAEPESTAGPESTPPTNVPYERLE